MSVEMHSKFNFYEKTISDSSDFQRQYLFKAIFTGGNDLDLITYLVSSTATPVETSGEIKGEWMNSNIKVGGRTEYSDWNVTCRDTIAGQAYSFFTDWRKDVYDRELGTSKVPGGYKRNVDLELVNHMGSTSVRMQLLGAFPKNIGESTLEYATEGFLTFQIVFAFDLFLVNP